MHIPPSPANKSTAGILWLLLLLWLLSWAAVADRITRTIGEATRRMADVSVDARDRTATRCKSLYQINELIKIRLAITVLTISALAPTVSLSLSFSPPPFSRQAPSLVIAEASRGQVQKMCWARSNRTGDVAAGTSLTAAVSAVASCEWQVARGNCQRLDLDFVFGGARYPSLYNIHKNHIKQRIANDCRSLSLSFSLPPFHTLWLIAKSCGQEISKSA